IVSFLSSRRRHTRSTRDWSSDVCSSDLQEALNRETGLSGHQLSVYAIGPAGENLVRFAAIHGDYGHVASKNGVGAVMGKKKLKRSEERRVGKGGWGGGVRRWREETRQVS